MFKDVELIHLSKAGFIPGPDESEEEFVARISFAKELKDHISQCGPFTPSEEAEELKKECCQRTKVLFGIEPSWVILVLSSHKLPFWQAGVAWIFQLSETGPLGAFVQVRTLAERGKGWFLYDPREIVVHELVHVARMAFEEPKYEELFAYEASHSRFRRFWGPLFRTSKESAIFIFLLGFLFVWDLFAFYLGSLALINAFLFLKLVPVLFLLVLVLRLISAQKTFLLTLKNLLPLCKDEEAARALRLRLTDEEIDHFSTLDSREIEEYIAAGREKSLRGRLLALFIKPR